MDLVSSTLDKYLKHRFNGNGLVSRSSDKSEVQIDSDSISKKVPATPATINSNEPQVPQANMLEQMAVQNEPSEAVTPKDTTELNDYQTRIPEITSENQQQPQETSASNNVVMTNGLSDSDNQLPTIQRISFKNSRPCCVALRDDLLLLAAGFENSHIYLWNFKDITSNKNVDTIFKLIAHSGPVYGIEFTNDNDLMLSCSEDTTIRLWCLNTKCNVFVYRGHNYPVWSLNISSQGNFFASASMDSTARLWHFDKITPIRILCGHSDDIECVKFHPNEKYIATGSSDATVRLWSTSDGKMVRLMVGHEDSIISLSFLPDGKFLASASKDGTIKVWNLATNRTSSELSAPSSYSISFSPEQKFIASCGVDNVMRLWRVDNAKMIERKRVDPNEPNMKLIQSHFHRDNKLFVIGYKTATEPNEQRNK